VRTVIFTIATGDKWRGLAGLLIATLRRFGGYQDDVVAFADGPVDGARVLPVSEIYEEAMDGEAAITNIHACRIGGARKMLEAGYDRIFYCDADCLAVRPIGELLELVDGDHLVVNPDNAWVEGTLAIESRWHSGFIRTPEERQRCRDLSMPTINAGTWLGTASALGELLDDYYKIWRYGHYSSAASERCREQAAFNYWCLRNHERIRYMPHRWIFCNVVGTWVKPPACTRIVHFFHQNVGMMPEYYERMLSGDHGLR